MKNLLITILLILFFGLCSCSMPIEEEMNKIENMDKIADDIISNDSNMQDIIKKETPTAEDMKTPEVFQSSTIRVQNNTTKEEVLLDGEEVAMILSFFNQATREKFRTKTYADYIFILDNDVCLYYSLMPNSPSLINNQNNYYHFYLSEEQSQYLNTVLQSYFQK